MKKIFTSCFKLSFAALMLTSLQACFSSDKKIINKDNVKRYSAIGITSGPANVVEKDAEIKFGQTVSDSEWYYTDYRPAENLVIKSELNDYNKISIGGEPKRGNLVSSSPVLADGKIFTLGGQGELQARKVENPDEIIWQVSVETEFSNEKNADEGFYDKLKTSMYDKNQFNGGNIAYYNGNIYVTTKRGNVFSYNADNGKLNWQKSTGVPIKTSPALGNDKLVITSFDDETITLSSNDGKILWRNSGIKEKSKFSTNPTPLIINGKVIVSYSSGEIYALDVNTGNPVWNLILANGFTIAGGQAAINDIKFSPIYGGGIIYIVSGDGSLNGVDVNSGQRLWTYKSRIVSTPWYANDYVFAVTEDKKIVAVNAKTGAEIFAKKVKVNDEEEEDDELNLSGPIIANSKIIVNDNKGKIIFISAKNGAVEATRSIPEGVELAPIAAGGKVYFIDQKSNLIILQ